MQTLDVEVWGPGNLLHRLEAREKFFVFDVRNRDEFERFRLEGRASRSIGLRPEPRARERTCALKILSN